MRLSIECLPCLINQAVRLAKAKIDNEEIRRSLMQRVISELANLDANSSSPYAAHKIQDVIKQYLNHPDPYQEEKHYYNTEMLKLENDFLDLIKAADDQISTALKLSAAGNIIDFGPGHELSRERVLAVIDETMQRAFEYETLEALQSRLSRCESLLYLGDNCGEIVLDKMFVRTIKEHYPRIKVQFATRGKPILNDVTEEDAYLVGMDAYAEIVNNGTDIPGTELKYCSPQFLEIFNHSQVIIAKGQGNFESLHGCGRENLYYIFMCKCNLFMEKHNAQQNDIVLMAEPGNVL